MKDIYKKSLEYTLLIATCLVAGYKGSQINLEERVAKEVAKAQGHTAKKFIPEVVLINDDYEIPKKTLSQETFEPATPEESQDYLVSKIGFKLEIDNLKHVKRDTSAPDIGLFFDKYGTVYSFEVLNAILTDPPQAWEQLMITYYNKDRSGSVFITDKNHDDIPDDISIRDNINNTKIIIYRNKDGVLTFEKFVDEAGARTLFDQYTTEYQRFKKAYDVNQRILEYERQLKIIQIDPNDPRIPLKFPVN